jgi:hypothetical protein
MKPAPPHDHGPRRPALIGATIPLTRTRAELRRCLRVACVNGPAVRVEVRYSDGTSMSGVCEDMAWSGAGVRFAAHSDPRLLPNETGVLVFRAHRLPDVPLHVRTVSASALEDGNTRYGFEFVREDELQARITAGWLRWFNRRRHLRVAPGGTAGARAVVGWAGGESWAWLREASFSGVSVELPLDAARLAARARQVEVGFTLPGTADPMRLRASVCNAVMDGQVARLGLRFVEDAEFEVWRPKLEAWNESMQTRNSDRLAIFDGPTLRAPDAKP